MRYFGINDLNHGSSIAVFDPKLQYFDISLNEHVHIPYEKPDRIFWYERPWIKKARQLYAGQYRTAFDMTVLPSQYLKSIGLGRVPIAYTPHHASHAAAGYYTSPFDQCAVVVLDAIGEFECATIWEGKHNELKKIWAKTYPNSLGLFYSAFTKLIGLEPIKQEHLLQEMAEQGDPKRYYNDVFNYTGHCVTGFKNMHRGIHNWPYLINNLQDQCDIAAAVQANFETQVCQVMDIAKTITRSNCLIYMGGCAMNNAANKKVVETKFEYIWSLPQPGDPSSAIGAVLYHTRNREQNWKWGNVKHIEIRT